MPTIMEPAASSNLDLICGLGNWTESLLDAVEQNDLVLATELLEAEQSGETKQNEVDKQMAYGHALEAACSNGFPGMVKLLVEHGANPDGEIDGSGRTASLKTTPLLLALQYGGGQGSPRQEETVRALLSAPDGVGCDVNRRLAWKSPLVLACGQTNLVALLVGAGADVHATDAQQRTVMHHAVIARDVSSLRLFMDVAPDLLQQADCKGDTPLHLAVRKGHLASLRCLIKHGSCDPDVRNARRDYDTPLYSACVNGQVAIIRELLDSGADPRPAAIFHLCSNHYDLQMLLMLIRYGAEVDYTPPHPALLPCSGALTTAVAKGWLEAAKVLLLAGARRILDADNLANGLVGVPHAADFVEWYRNHKGGHYDRATNSLKHACRMKVRSVLLRKGREERKSLPAMIGMLNVPKPVHDYLCFDDL